MILSHIELFYVSWILLNIGIRINLSFRNRKDDTEEVPVILHIGRIVLRLTDGFVRLVDTFHWQSIAHQVVHTMALAYQLLATFVEHVVQCQHLVLHTIGRIGTLHNGIEILHSRFIVTLLHGSFGCIQIGFRQTNQWYVGIGNVSPSCGWYLLTYA